MKKRLTALLLVLAMLLSAIPSALAEESGFTRSRSYTDGQFTDVLSTDWFSGDVKNAYELGLMQGTGNQTFSPNGTVTLAETVAVAARIHAIASLSDVSFTQGTPWYQVYVDYALANGILSAALPDYTRAATRLEFAQILAKALPESALACINTIADGAIPDVADDASVYLLYRAGILTGSDAAGTFYPSSSIRRSEMAAIVARMADPALRKSLTLGAASTSADEASGSGDTAVSAPVLPDASEEESDESTVLTQPFDLENPELFASGEVSYSGEQILIKFSSGYSGALSAGLSAAGITALEPLMSVSSGEWYVGYTSGDVTEVMSKVRALNEVLLAEYDYVYETSDTILDADCVREECSGNIEGYDAWHLLTAQLQDAWDYLSRLEGYTGHFGGSSSVVVAVIDTGVDYTHEDLKDNIWYNTAEIPDNGIDDDGNGYIDDYYGVNLETGRGSGMDDNGHGTHVAGIIAGANNNLGFTLRNRWGKADDAVVTVSCNSPYVSFENASINYGSVGTYSTQDCGLVKDGESITDLENPFLMHVSKDCPNDYILTLTVTVTYKNGLDAKDTATYSSKTTVDLDVRRGVILPDLISEDMTLTAENYYILPNATEIAAGATVTVEAGTQIQFWSDDPNDPYADTYIAYLMVRGTLLFEGTEDERIRLFPSERMSNYIVQIYEVDDGYISMKYTDVVNGVLYSKVYTGALDSSWSGISYAYGCEFTQNYNDRQLQYRKLDNGKVENNICGYNVIQITEAEQCAFYRCGSLTSLGHTYRVFVFGYYKNCMFADSLLQFNPNGTAGNWGLAHYNYTPLDGCVFYGNHPPMSADAATTYEIAKMPTTLTIDSISRDESNGTTTAHISTRYPVILARFAEYVGGLYTESSSDKLPLCVTIELPDGDTEWTEAAFLAAWDAFCEKGYNTNFYHNAILNRFTDTNVAHWLRIQAPEGSSEDVYGIGGNYWGTSGMSEKRAEEVIGLQIVDNRDYKTLARLNEGEVLDEVPEDVWPCVTNAGLLNESGEPVTTVGNETLTFFVEFNRDMDTSIPLTVSFGSSEPYADYTVSGEYVSARRWEGKMTLNTLVESGTQYWSISNGRSSDGHWKLYRDWGRFTFVIDTTSALAMIMQGSGEDDGVHLSWFQDEFETLAGYNVYRATSENGQYSRLNTNLIPAGTEEWVDTGVLPGEVYYYNFEVVKTDLSTSYTSPKISVQAKDTMAPSLYHEPVYSAFTGSNLVLSATATDNVAIASVSVFYRAVGETDFREMRMENLNDRYSAIIGANFLTTDGLEYYIRAFDGLNYTYKGSAEEPFTVTISEAIDADALGDVDGNGQISVLDALLILQQLNGLYNMTAEEFARADLNGDGSVSAAEALRIVQYANGMIGSVRMTAEGSAT